MRILGLAFWYMWRSFINGIKRAWKVFLIFAVVFAVFFLGGFVVGKIVGDKQSDAGEATESAEEPEEEIDIATYVPKAQYDFVSNEDGLYFFENGEAHEVSELVIKCICSLVILLLLSVGIQSGAKNGANIFIMPDVNFLFPSPNKPQSVLLFRMIGQIGATLIGAFYIVFQIPNLINGTGIGVAGAAVLVLAYLLLAVVGKMIGVLTYCLCQNHKKVKRFISRYSFLITGIPVLIVLALNRFAGTTIYDGTRAVFESRISYAVPFWGWLNACAGFAVSGKIVYALLMLAVTVIGTVILVAVTWQIPCDFYEDALTFAQDTAAREESVAEMAQGASAHDVKHKGKSWEKKREKKLAFDGYEGAKVFFAKTMLNRRRMHPLMGLWSPTCSTYFFSTLGVIAALKYLVKANDPRAELISATLLIIVFMFFRSFANPLQTELSLNFIYMIPEPPRALLRWGMLSQMADGALDLLPACVLGAVMTGRVGDFAMAYLLLVSMHLFFGMTALMVNLVVSGYLPVYISNMLQVLIRLIPFAPVLIVFFVGALSDNYSAGAVICIIINLIASELVFLPCPSHLHRGKR